MILLPLLLLLQSAAPSAPPTTDTPGPTAPEAPHDWAKEFGFEDDVRDPITGELPVADYDQSNANAGASPVNSDRLANRFGGQAGINRITNRLVDLSLADPRIAPIFAGRDMVRLRRILFEQFCYILDAGCSYSGRNMRAAHQDMGLQMNDMNALVENLQQAMREEHVPFGSQNRLLAKIAPMKRDVIQN